MMSRVLVAASSQYLRVGSTPVTAAPLTLAAWFKTTSNPASVRNILAINVAANAGYFRLALYDNDVYVSAVEGAAIGQVGGGTVTLNTWNHAAAVFTSTTSRASYWNGGEVAVDSTLVVPLNLDQIDVGTLSQTDFHDGSIAEVGIWNVALSAGDITALAAGSSPMSLATLPVRYWRFKADLDFTDLIAASVITNNGSTWGADHPAVDDPPAAGGWPGSESLAFAHKQRAPMPMIVGPREDRIMSMQGRQKG